MMDSSNSTDQHDEFYVGYLPMPDGHRKFITTLLFTLFLWFAGMAFIIVTTMREPGFARWETGAIKHWTGTLVAKPYPLLIPDDTNSPAIFVVSMGKHGAQDRLKDSFGKHVTLAGYELNRDGRLLIELDDAQSAIEIDSSATSAEQEPQLIESIKLTGEIVDGKCYLGAMKPGDGIGHKACATLCIRGGLPPMFAAQTEKGSTIYYLLQIDGSTEYSEESLGLVGQRVQISAEYSTLYGLPMLDVDADQIVPLSN